MLFPFEPFAFPCCFFFFPFRIYYWVISVQWGKSVIQKEKSISTFLSSHNGYFSSNCGWQFVHFSRCLSTYLLCMSCRAINCSSLWSYKSPVYVFMWIKIAKVSLLTSHQFNLSMKSNLFPLLHSASWLCLHHAIRILSILVTIWAHSGNTACFGDAAKACPVDKSQTVNSCPLFSCCLHGVWILQVSTCCPTALTAAFCNSFSAVCDNGQTKIQDLHQWPRRV